MRFFGVFNGFYPKKTWWVLLGITRVSEPWFEPEPCVVASNAAVHTSLLSSVCLCVCPSACVTQRSTASPGASDRWCGGECRWSTVEVRPILSSLWSLVTTTRCCRLLSRHSWLLPRLHQSWRNVRNYDAVVVAAAAAASCSSSRWLVVVVTADYYHIYISRDATYVTTTL